MAGFTALTTTFTPPASCLSDVYLSDQSNIPAIILGNPQGTASCLPSGIDPLRTSFFSPGLYCPSGYTNACSTTVTIGSAKETQVTCCPLYGLTCQVSSYWPFDSSYGCGVKYSTDTEATVITSGSGSYYTTVTKMTGGYDVLNAYSVA
jgi:hypothetical protein